MPQALVATYTPKDFGAKEAFTFDGKLFRVNSSFALARQLIAAGYDPKDTLAVAYQDGRLMNPWPLEQLAVWEISEDEKRITRRRHRTGRLDQLRTEQAQKAAERVGVVGQNERLALASTDTAMTA